jgi:hypothetical protein
MPNSFYGDPQDSPNSEAQDTIGLLIGRYVTNIETGTFVTKSWLGTARSHRHSSPSTMARSSWL